MSAETIIFQNGIEPYRLMRVERRWKVDWYVVKPDGSVNRRLAWPRKKDAVAVAQEFLQRGVLG